MSADSHQLLTDYYQLTMTYAGWKAKRHAVPAVFHLYFRSNPFHGGYTVAAGHEPAYDWLEGFAFQPEDLLFLKELKGPDGKVLFEPAFLEFLRTSRFECDVEAVPEGSVVFPNEPLVKVRGPLWQCQWIETALLNMINFQSLVATKAARLVEAARGEEVVEFGLRRAQGPDGSLSASRAAYIGGVAGTSSVIAGRRYGIPLRGTHAHSWVMAFDSEREAFDAYAEAFPSQCTLLVDTYDTLGGVEHAIATGQKLRAQGKELAGIRLDSGDLAYLSIEARRRLDAAGLTRTRIIASNELDEGLIQSLHLQEARIDVWGVGTKLVTAFDQPALSGVFKLAAVKDAEGWKSRIKVSDQPAKTSNPGLHRIRRFFNAAGGLEGDLIYDESEDPTAADRIIDPVTMLRSKRIRREWKAVDVLEPVFRAGSRVQLRPTLETIRQRVKAGMAQLHPSHKRLENPHIYPVGLSTFLAELKAGLIQSSQMGGG